MAELVSKTYATALFDVAQEAGKEQEYFQELQDLDGIFSAHKDLMTVLKSPVFSKEEKKRMLTEIFAGKVSEYMMNFLKVLVDKDRIGLFDHITQTYKKLLHQKNNIEEVTAITAVAMTAQMQDALAQKLKQSMGKEILLHNKVDESILGGVLLKIGNEQIDGSVKNRLETIKRELSSMIAK